MKTLIALAASPIVLILAIVVTRPFIVKAQPPTPPMSLSTLRQVRWSGHTITLTNYLIEGRMTVINGQTNIEPTFTNTSYEKIELGLAPGGDVKWRQVQP